MEKLKERDDEGVISVLKEIMEPEIFIDDEDVLDDLPIGILSKYADPEKKLLEEGAFERAMVEKHGNG